MSQSKPAPSTAPQDTDSLLKGPFALTDASKAFGETVLAPQIAMWAELLRFCARRLEAQAALVQDVSKCRDVPDAMERQAAFVNATASDYAEEASALMSEARRVTEKAQARA